MYEDTNNPMNSSAGETKPEAAARAACGQEQQTPDASTPYAYRNGTPGTERAFTPEQTAEKAKPKRNFLRTVAAALSFGLIAGVVMFGVNAGLTAATGAKNADGQAPEQPAAAPTAQVAVAKGSGTAVLPANTAGTVANVAANTLPATVAITTKTVQEVHSFFFGGQSQTYENDASGSGIIIGKTDTELLIATNAHVVSDSRGLSVAFIDNAAAEAQIKGADSENDLAVIAVKLEDVSAETLSAIRIVELGDSDRLVVGEQVVAIGNALGYGQSVTAGYVSALNREITLDGVKKNLIQTDAAINPGNSGGALLNMQGQLIGINEAKAATNYVEGMGYAIPVSVAEPILNELMNKETRYKAADGEAGYLGISCTSVSEEAANYYGMPRGAYIAEVTANGPAANAGIQEGDIIVKFDGEAVGGSNELVELVSYYVSGTAVTVTVARADNGAYVEKELSVTLGSKSQMTQS